MSATNEDHQLASRLATEAGALLLELRAGFEADDVDPKIRKDEGDRQAHEFLMRELLAARPEDAVLSEEGADDLVRLNADRVWIVDPLDGTREYSETGRSDWAVHVALTIGGEVVAGAVALPKQDQTLDTAAPAALVEATGSSPRVIVSRTRPPAVAVDLVAELGGELVEMGSAGAKAMAVVQGKADIYPHAGGQYEWDSCAPVAVAQAAGLHVSRLDGSPMRYNNENPYLPDLLICRPEFAEATLAFLADKQY